MTHEYKWLTCSGCSSLFRHRLINEAYECPNCGTRQIETKIKIKELPRLQRSILKDFTEGTRGQQLHVEDIKQKYGFTCSDLVSVLGPMFAKDRVWSPRPGYLKLTKKGFMEAMMLGIPEIQEARG